MGKKEDKREKILQEKETEEDVILNMSLRPASVKDFIGQDKAIENLKISLEAAKKRKESLASSFRRRPPSSSTSAPHAIR